MGGSARGGAPCPVRPLMRPPPPRLALGLAAGVLALAWSGFIGWRHLEGRASFLDRIEATLLDLRFLLDGPRKPPGDVIIVAIDDQTVREAGRYPLPRGTVARLIREISRHSPRAIGLDILFLDPGQPEQDAELAASLRDAGAIVAAAGLFDRNTPAVTLGPEPDGTTSLPQPERILFPIDAIRTVAPSGLVNITTDHAGTPRHVPMLFWLQKGVALSFALRVASAAGGPPTLDDERITVGSAVSRMDAGMSLPLRFYGSRGTIPTVSAQAVLRGDVPPERLRDRIVVVGSVAVGAGDSFTTPFDQVLPGVEVLGTAVSHLIHADGLVRDTTVRRIDVAAAFVMAVAAVALLAATPLSPALLLVAALAVGWFAVTALAFRSGFWLSAAVPLVALLPPALLATLGRQLLDRRESDHHASAEAALRLFQPPALADRIAADPAFLAKPHEQAAAVLFIDLSRFTHLSEQLGPARTRELLRDFHILIETETDAAGGIVLSFMGDGAMIAFGLPEPTPADAAQALQACFALLERTRAWLDRLRTESGADLDVRLGAHYGPVVVSRLGAQTHQHITVTGDTVNVASRLLEVAAQEGSEFAASADFLAAAGDDAPGRSRLRDLKAVAIRGRDRPLWVAVLRHHEASGPSSNDGTPSVCSP